MIGCLLCSLVVPGIVSIFCQREIIAPVVLLLIHPEVEVLFQPQIGAFELPICAGVEGSRDILSDPQLLA